MLNELNDFIFEIINSQDFKNLIGVSPFKIAQFNALTTFLIKNGIPFDVEYKNATRREDASLSVTIYINPNTTLVYNFSGLSENDTPS